MFWHSWKKRMKKWTFNLFSVAGLVFKRELAARGFDARRGTCDKHRSEEDWQATNFCTDVSPQEIRSLAGNCSFGSDGGKSGLQYISISFDGFEEVNVVQSSFWKGPQSTNKVLAGVWRLKCFWGPSAFSVYRVKFHNARWTDPEFWRVLWMFDRLSSL